MSEYQDQPLTEILRPKNLQEFIGQEHLVGKDGIVINFIASGKIPSLIFWGSPATGKTTLAKLIAQNTNYNFLQLSAVMDGKDEFKKILNQIQESLIFGKKTILFIDEIHRWNKAQQDSLLPYVEDGRIILIGATTENPSFSIISALLSRCRVLLFNQHSSEDILKSLLRAKEYLKITIENELLQKIVAYSDNDMRYALNTLEIAHNMSKNGILNLQIIQNAAQRSLSYDKNGEEHFNLISAVHKSLRSSQASAATYWVVRMLEAGEDPLYIARRLIRFASEDIGNANPNALLLANQAYYGCQNLGMPECAITLVQLVKYLADCPKDNSIYKAYKMAKSDIKNLGSLPVPMHLRNAPTKLMSEFGYGKGYEYDHDLESKQSTQQCLPDKLKNQKYF
jgi:putative ATPase